MGLTLQRWYVSSIFGARAGFGMDASHIFPQGVLVVTPLIGGVLGVVISRACAGCEAGLHLCSVAVTGLLGVGPAPQLLE